MGLQQAGERKRRNWMGDALETKEEGHGFDSTRAFVYLKGNLHSFP
jgi:hypothetical protein